MQHMGTGNVAMFFIMVVSGLLSTMNVWADSLDDMRFSLNDLYMTLLMTGWMFFFMGLHSWDLVNFAFGLVLVLVSLWLIRTQFMITESQYIAGMIPHHSMAIHMSKNLLGKSPRLTPFLDKIITTQRDEIVFMKTL